MKKYHHFLYFFPFLLFLMAIFILNLMQKNSPAQAQQKWLNTSLVAGTEVWTKDGLRAIEEITVGTEIRAYDLESDTWSLKPITEALVHEYTGNVIMIKAEGMQVKVTENHPFWVLRGMYISSRPSVLNIPTVEQALIDKGRWVEAKNLQSGDVLLLLGDKELKIDDISASYENLIVYNLIVADFHTFAIHSNGILASDATRGLVEPYYDDSGKGGCFVAGTQVRTENGPVAIEKITRGTRVYAYNNQTCVWALKSVTNALVHDYKGDLITLLANNIKIQTTGNHPFYVLRGENMSQRPVANDIPLAERGLSSRGRWISARNLKPEDVLLLLGNEQASITEIFTYQAELKVYNITVEDFHTYAVHDQGVLVHNKGQGEGEAEEGIATIPETIEGDERGEEKTRTTTSTSGLRAGYADDNKQFNYFIQFLQKYGPQVEHEEIDITERIIIKVLDKDGKSLPNTHIKINNGNQTLCAGKTYADGSFYFFPSEYQKQISEYQVTAEYNQMKKSMVIQRQGNRLVEMIYNFSRRQMQTVPLDIVFILDTTGSMGEEIQRLKSTIEIIYLNISSLSTKPAVRFGMVLYRDRGDIYITKTVALTDDLEQFQKALDQVAANGGGDEPEDLQAALWACVQQINWNADGIRLCYVITDAPPHLDYNQEYTYVNAAHNAREKAIKYYTVGTGGLNLMGEYILRQLSQYTAARYIFLTYGETGESEGGEPGSVSHHTGVNYQTDKLESIIIRFTKEELQYLTDKPITEVDEYLAAQKISQEDKEQTLHKLFQMALNQLIDYSTYNIEKGTPVAAIPIHATTSSLSLVSEYFSEQLMFSLYQDNDLQQIFHLVERKDLQQVLAEIELQMGDLMKDDNAARVGKLMGARLLFTGTLYEQEDNYILFLKLLRVETAEVLSITKAVIDKDLGI